MGLGKTTVPPVDIFLRVCVFAVENDEDLLQRKLGTRRGKTIQLPYSNYRFYG